MRLALEGRRLEPGDELDGRLGEADRLVERGPEMPSSSPRRGTRENPPTRTLTGWIERPPRAAMSSLPVFLIARPCGDELTMIARHRQRRRVAQEVGGVEQIDVEGMALDPFPAVEQAA